MSEEKKKSDYKLCWVCNKKFRGSYKYEYTIPFGPAKTGLKCQTVYVHKWCRP